VNSARINSSSKCSNCYGPHAFGDPAVLCVKFVLYDIQGYRVEFRCPRKALRKGALYFTLDAELHSLKASLHIICDKHVAYFRDYYMWL